MCQKVALVLHYIDMHRKNNHSIPAIGVMLATAMKQLDGKANHSTEADVKHRWGVSGGMGRHKGARVYHLHRPIRFGQKADESYIDAQHDKQG
jgi:hypothetical protein